jgi:hypothetical protein
MTDGRYVTLLVHAESKVGKTWLGDTGPAPRLILDCEAGGIRFTESRKVWWNPLTEVIPVVDGSWDTCVVSVKSIQALTTAFSWLNSGEHPFRSVTLDSVMEIQAIAKREIRGTNTQFDQQNWGTLFDTMDEQIRRFRDLTEHPTNPLEAVVYICGTKMKDGMFRPLLDGQIILKLPYLVDACGYLYTAKDESGALRRALLIEPGGIAVAGNRFGGKLPGTVWDPNVTTMLDTLFGPKE